MNLTEVVKASGIVGAGGAGFPTHVKLNAKAECFVVNAAECEPLIETDKYLCRTYAPQIIAAVVAVAAHLEAKRAVIALYEGGRLADLHAQSRRIQLLNATAEERVVLCSPTPRRLLAETFDCRGRAVDRRELLVEACTLLAVPACGLARLTAL